MGEMGGNCQPGRDMMEGCDGGMCMRLVWERDKMTRSLAGLDPYSNLSN